MSAGKRYALFAGECYYAQGGVFDFCESSNDLDHLKSKGRDLVKEYNDWWHVVDLETMDIIAGTESQAHGATDIKGGEK